MLGTPELRELVQQMIDTMRAAPGVGLAAPQIGVPLRVRAAVHLACRARGCTGGLGGWGACQLVRLGDRTPSQLLLAAAPRHRSAKRRVGCNPRQLSSRNNASFLTIPLLPRS